MTELPEPLVPAEVDLRDFRGMWLDTERLLRSDTWVLGNSDEKAAAMTLWLEAWHQVPAASLPANDRLLSKLSGAERWGKSKAHALRGWVECNDGRLYHPVVAEKALEAWVEKLAAAISGAIGNAKRWQVCVDTEHLRQQFRVAVDRLRAIDPQSRALKKKAVAVILGGSPPDAANTSGPQSPPESGPDARKSSPPDRSDQTGPDRTGSLSPADAGEKSPRAKPSSPPDRPDGVDEETWADWLELRRRKKAPVTATVLRGAVKEAAKAGMTLDAFLQVWCVRGSQGLQADWLSPQELGGARPPARAAPRQTSTDRAVATLDALTGRSNRGPNHDPRPEPPLADVVDVTARRVG